MPVPISRDAMSVDAQTAKLEFKPSTNNPNVFIPRNVGGTLGSIPTVMVNWCKLPPHGKKEENLRGVVSYTSHNGNTFNRLKLALGNDTSSDVFELCRRVHHTFAEQYPPVGKSMWWQRQFNFLDGTKVFSGTAGVSDPELYNSFIFDGSDKYSAPSKTFASALYSDSPDAMWYASVSVPTYGNRVTGDTIVLYDADLKPFKNKYDGSTEIYKAGGIPIEDHDGVNTLSNSNFFKNHQWTCRTVLQLSSLEWKSAIDETTGNRVVFPIFHFKTVGSIVLKVTPYVLPDGVVPVDKRKAFLDTLLFEGMAGSTKKRKTKTKAVSKPKKVIVHHSIESSQDSDLEIVTASDIEGDREEQ